MKSETAQAANPWGPLDNDNFCALPPGFTYYILQQRGGNNDPMTDGYQVPGRADGMECWLHPTLADHYILMCNHENSSSNGAYSGSGPDEAYANDRKGAVTRIVVDNSGSVPVVVENNLVLTGTQRNCGGGWSPWGWLSCEETEISGHGYVFLCDIMATSVQYPDRKDVYGRFNHEAAVVDPDTHICYLTEDTSSSGFYRFVPDDFSDPWGAGTFQALRRVGDNNYDSDAMSQDQVIDVEWVDINDNNLPWSEASGKGAIRFRRGEGIARDHATGEIYVCATTGSKIFCYDDSAKTLTLVGSNSLDGSMSSPDNIIVSPWGDVWYAEDTSGDVYAGFIDTEQGAICEFARNDISEFAGVCFAPDGKAMFINIQGANATLMITGPFPDLPSNGDGDGDGDGDGSTTGDGDGDGSTTGDGDGDGSTTGDGDGDGSTTGDGDGDGSTTGDGDGDGSTTGDGDGDTTGGDGDTTGGDGDTTGGDGDTTGGDGDTTGGDGNTTGGDGDTGDSGTTGGDGSGTGTSGGDSGGSTGGDTGSDTGADSETGDSGMDPMAEDAGGGEGCACDVDGDGGGASSLALGAAALAVRAFTGSSSREPELTSGEASVDPDHDTRPDGPDDEEE